MGSTVASKTRNRKQEAAPPDVGATAPDFEAPTDSGERVRLSDFRGRKVILYFYPKDATPGCTQQACGFRDAYDAIRERGAVVLGVSPDDAASHRRFREKQHLPFPLLVDEGARIARLYGVWGEKSMYGRKYMGILRSHFVIGEDGRILDARVKVSPRDSVRLALAALG